MDRVRVCYRCCEGYQNDRIDIRAAQPAPTSFLIWMPTRTLGPIDQAHEGGLQGLFRLGRDILDDAGIVRHGEGCLTMD